MTPDFSILHPTIRLPDGWRTAHDTWLATASDPSSIEYLLIVDRKDFDGRPRSTSNEVRVIMNPNRECYVDAQNWGARAATGKWLITASDDWLPAQGWDAELRRLVPGPLHTEAVVNVVNNHHPQLIIYPILTRAYYERPGRGGHPNGELFYPDYLSMGSDDDLTMVAYRDKVVIESPLQFEHKHPWRGDTSHDTHGAYAHVQSHEAWDVSARTLPRRERENFAS